jgi:hypothetical protein
MQDWKAGSIPIVMLRGWCYDQAQRRREASNAPRPWRSIIRRGVAVIGGLLARGG